MRMTRARGWPALLAAAATAALSVPAIGQSLMEGEPLPPPTNSGGAALPSTGGPTPTGTPLVAADPVSSAERLQGVSLFAVVPPKPRTYQKHDLIEVLINETSVSKMEQTLDTKKDYDLDAEVSDFPSIRHLLELQLRNGDSTGLPVGVGVKSKNKFKGEGEFERKDNLTARMSAKVIDVKPNGTLVLEARKSRQQDKETYTLVLSGVCRSEDVTRSNTVQTAQLADLNIRIDHEGRVKDAAEKGIIPRVLDAIFNF